MMHATVRSHFLALAVLVTAASLIACARQARITITPDIVRLAAGSRATVTISGEQTCEEEPCRDTTGREFDFILQGLPDGVTYTVDTRLRSPRTPGLVQVILEVQANV